MRLEMVQLLLENGVDPSGRGGLEIAQTPLQRAIQSGDVDIAMLLLKWGADPNTVARRTPPLHMAVQQGHTALVRCLFEHGAQSSYQFKGKKYTVRQETAMLKNIATLLGEMGLDKALIHEVYLILD
jgi:ankyrin repeat protein